MPSYLIENVAREGEPNFNADVKCDLIIDTYATPWGLSNGNGYNANCEYTGTHVDPTGRPYSDYEPEVKNYMSYTSECADYFTVGQGVRMRWFLELWDNNYPTAGIVELFGPEELYYPFRGEYYLAGPHTKDHHPMFQYGFTYKFVDVSQADVYNQPSDYSDTSFWYGQAVETFYPTHNQPIEHLNHRAFIIQELGDPQPRMCYNNANRAPSNGNLIQFTDGIPNGNYTITPQDSLQINNPSLIEQLNPGLYNIQMNYNDGTVQDNTVLKENN
ncbi:MAG: hypothetical protein R2773_03960 [Flavobacteriaceae bacterium]